MFDDFDLTIQCDEFENEFFLRQPKSTDDLDFRDYLISVDEKFSSSSSVQDTGLY